MPGDLTKAGASMPRGWAETVLFVATESVPPHREEEGAFLQPGPCFCTQEPVPRPLPTKPHRCSGMQWFNISSSLWTQGSCLLGGGVVVEQKRLRPICEYDPV